MPQVIYTQHSLDDLIRLRAFLLEKSVAAADKARGTIRSNIKKLPSAPEAHRPVPSHPYLRDLIIGFGATGYIARYHYQRGSDIYILRIRHQLEAGFDSDELPKPSAENE
jgi:plasmid stabilization system protein ParE